MYLTNSKPRVSLYIFSKKHALKEIIILPSIKTGCNDNEEIQE